MQLPPDDWGSDLSDAPLLPDEGQEVLGLPDNDMLGDVLGDHLTDQGWLERTWRISQWRTRVTITIAPASQVDLLMIAVG